MYHVPAMYNVHCNARVVLRELYAIHCIKRPAFYSTKYNKLHSNTTISSGKDISGVFEIRTLSGSVVGVLSLKMEWSLTYLTPVSTPDVITPLPDQGYRKQCDVDTGQCNTRLNNDI